MKKAVSIILCLIIIICLPIEIIAVSKEDFENAVEEKVSEIPLSGEIGEFGVDLSDYQNVENIDSQTVFDYFLSLIKKSLRGPLKFFVSVTVICLLNCVLSSFSDLCETVTAVIAFTSTSYTVLSVLYESTDAIKSVSAFMLSYVPIYASICITTGNAGGALSYNTILLSVCEGISGVINFIIIPLLACILVIGISQSFYSNVSGFSNSVRKILGSVIGFILTVFTGVIALQTGISRTKYTLGIRAGRYIVSSFVPILGSAINESSEMVKTSLASIKSAVGIFGIVIISLIFAVPLVSLTMYKLSVYLSQSAASLLGSSKISSYLDAVGQVFSSLRTIYLLLLLAFTLSTGILLSSSVT